MLKEAYSGVSTKITFSYSNQRFCTETVMNRTKVDWKACRFLNRLQLKNDKHDNLRTSK